jgi:hypothetical protein
VLPERIESCPRPERKVIGVARRDEHEPAVAETGKDRRGANLLGEVYSWFTEGFGTADLKEAKLLLERLA